MKRTLLTVATVLLAGCARQTSRQSPVTFHPGHGLSGPI